MAHLNSAHKFENSNDERYLPSTAQQLRSLLHNEGDIIIAPGVYDGLTARLALAAGHKCLYMTGAGTSVARLGLPDLGFLTLNDMYANAAMIAGLDRTIPVIADADTGFGGAVQVARTVSLFMSAGIAGLHIEDQVLMKRCGHLSGKETVDPAEFFTRISAAVMARKRERGDIVIIARTDALQQRGYDDAVSRLRGAIALGADVAFLEGIESVEQAQQAVVDLAPTPLLFNMVPGGVSPNMSSEEAQKLGFRIIIFPGAALGPVAAAVGQAMSELNMAKRHDAIGNHEVLTPRDLFEKCGLSQCMTFDQEVAASLATVYGR